MIKEGEPAPDFDLPADDGKRLRLRALRGVVAVVYFYPADGTETCTLEAQQFSARAREFKSASARVIGISPDTVASHCKFRDKYELALTLASDESLAVCKAYGVWQQKTLFGRTYMGIERSTVVIGPDGRIAKIWRKVKVPGHAEAVLAAAKAL